MPIKIMIRNNIIIEIDIDYEGSYEYQKQVRHS